MPNDDELGSSYSYDGWSPVLMVIVRSGDVLTLYPAATSIPEMIARLETLPVPPFIEERDDEELPERVGL